MKNFNKSEIFKNAWAIVKNEGMTISEALKKAWEMAKMSEGMKCAVARFNRYFTNHGYAEIVMECKKWMKYGKDRTYVNALAKNYSGEIVKTYKVGYIDNVTDQFYSM